MTRFQPRRSAALAICMPLRMSARMPLRMVTPLSLLISLSAALASTASAQMVALPPPQNVLVLAADASAEVQQDLLSITLQTTREGSDAAAVQSQLRQTLDSALAEARKAVRPGQVEVRTGAFSLFPRYAVKPVGGNAISGWQGRAELLLEGRDIAAISQLAGRLGAAAGNTGMTVARVAFGLSREVREATEADVAARAINKFKARADTYAKQFGFGSYSLREINVGSADLQAPAGQPMMRSARLAAAPAMDESQPVEAGKATLTVNVSGSIQLSPR